LGDIGDDVEDDFEQSNEDEMDGPGTWQKRVRMRFSQRSNRDRATNLWR